MDRKLYLLVESYNVTKCQWQEFKGPNGLWPATGGYTMLHSGRPAPGAGDVIAKREDVGLVINKRATAVWRAADEVWKPVNSRVIMARLKWTRQWRWRSVETFVTFICVSAPTAKAHPDVRSQFLKQLQDTLDDVPQGNALVALMPE